jgi:DNA-directed RNA polymerase subunit RPC12/RpoP
MARDDDRRLPCDRVVPTSGSKARMACAECGATFFRSRVESSEKGTLACPECGSRAISDADGGR